MTRATLRTGALGAGLGALAIWMLPPLIQWFGAPDRVMAQERPMVGKTLPPKDVTLTGRVVDLHGMITGEYATQDHERCTAQSIRSGVPAGLETENGLIVLGQGVKGPGRALLAHAFKQVEIEGKLYEKAGVKYLDIKTVKKLGQRGQQEEEEFDEPDEPGDPDDPDDPGGTP